MPNIREIKNLQRAIALYSTKNAFVNNLKLKEGLGLLNEYLKFNIDRIQMQPGNEKQIMESTLKMVLKFDQCYREEMKVGGTNVSSNLVGDFDNLLIDSDPLINEEVYNVNNDIKEVLDAREEMINLSEILFKDYCKEVKSKIKQQGNQRDSWHKKEGRNLIRLNLLENELIKNFDGNKNKLFAKFFKGNPPIDAEQLSDHLLNSELTLNRETMYSKGNNPDIDKPEKTKMSHPFTKSIQDISEEYPDIKEQPKIN